MKTGDTGFEPVHDGVKVRCLTAWLIPIMECRREDLNPQPTDYKSVALPIELQRLVQWWALTGSNRRPSACKADALPAELSALSMCIVLLVIHKESDP